MLFGVVGWGKGGRLVGKVPFGEIRTGVRKGEHGVEGSKVKEFTVGGLDGKKGTLLEVDLVMLRG